MTDLALTHVTVIDPERDQPQRDLTVLISGGRITKVGEQLRIKPGTPVVDLTGKFLIPGLADLHAHSISSERISPPLYVLNGVTTVREMAASAEVSDWRRKIDRPTARPDLGDRQPDHRRLPVPADRTR